MTDAWTQQPERGSLFLVRFIAWLARAAGRSVAGTLLHPITLYFVVFSRTARHASAAYLTRVLGRPARFGDVYRHYHTFATTILDRVYFLTDRFEMFDIRIEGLEALKGHSDAGRGCILLGAHLGSFEVMRALAVLRGELPLKILMYEENSRRLSGVLRALNPRVADSVISLGAPTAMMEVKEWLDQGGIVGILGDRTAGSGSAVEVPFLGERAPIPVGPYQLAALTGAPVVMFCGLYRGGRRYDLMFDAFADRIRLSRRRRRAGEASAPVDEDRVEELATRFAERMETWCRAAPFNWFNFYDFWRRGDGDG